MSFSPRTIPSQRWHSGRNANAKPRPRPRLRFRKRHQTQRSVTGRGQRAKNSRIGQRHLGGVLGRADHCRRSAVTSVASLPALATEAWVTSLDATRGSDPRNRRISLGTFDRLHPSRDGGSTKHKSGRSAERPHAEPLSLAGAKRALSWNLDRYPERSELMILAMLTRVWAAPVEAVGAGWRESWNTRWGVQEAGQVTSSGPGRGDL